MTVSPSVSSFFFIIIIIKIIIINNSVEFVISSSKTSPVSLSHNEKLVMLLISMKFRSTNNDAF